MVSLAPVTISAAPPHNAPPNVAPIIPPANPAIPAPQGPKAEPQAANLVAIAPPAFTAHQVEAPAPTIAFHHS